VPWSRAVGDRTLTTGVPESASAFFSDRTSVQAEAFPYEVGQVFPVSPRIRDVASQERVPIVFLLKSPREPNVSTTSFCGLFRIVELISVMLEPLSTWMPEAVLWFFLESCG
jgi:hypothetical protein